MPASVDSRWRALWSAWRPGRCVLCAERLPAGEELCAPCHTELPRLAHACARCAAPLPDTAPAETECGRCQQHPPPFAQVHAAYHYRAPLDRLVLRLKFGRDLSMARLLGEHLAQSLTEAIRVSPDLIVPVPLHRARLRARGYNQSLEIARVLARRLGVPLDVHGVRRVRATREQARLSADERKRNLRNAFAARRDYRGLHVALVDDVMTSGHTAAAAARCLMRAGAAEVVVWVVARA
jgi:ComF family protein